MSRTARTFLHILGRKGPGWLPRILFRAAGLRLSHFPRGLLLEPTTVCDGGCPCCVPSPPAHLPRGVLEAWLGCLPSRPATIAFVGRHSDPLCSPHLPALVEAAKPVALLISVSTIGIGLRPDHLAMPVDRWIVAIPGATGRSYAAVRGRDSLAEVLSNIRKLRASGTSQVEVVLTLWKPSSADAGAFREMARTEGWKDIQIAQGIYDPTGFDVGRPEMLATGFPEALYSVTDGIVERRRAAGPCPASGYLFIDATGILRPCLFAASGPCWKEPSRESWLDAASFERDKASRPFPECRWCP